MTRKKDEILDKLLRSIMESQDIVLEMVNTNFKMVLGSIIIAMFAFAAGLVALIK